MKTEDKWRPFDELPSTSRAAPCFRAAPSFGDDAWLPALLWTNSAKDEEYVLGHLSAKGREEARRRGWIHWSAK